MAEMLAVQFDSYGGPDVLKIRKVAKPAVASGHVLVRTAATSINAADALVRSGKLSWLSGKKFPRGTGYDFTGEVVDVGSDASDYHAGDQVWGFINYGVKAIPAAAAAEFILAPVDSIAPRPRTIDAVEAAALAGAGGAALGVLRDGVRVRQGERVLIRGAGGGVGTSAVQIAKALGTHVTALVRADHLDQVRGLGADEAFDYRNVDPASLGRFDAIFDLTGKNMRAYRPLLTERGRMATITIGSFGDAVYLIASAIFGGRRVRFLQFPPGAELLRALASLVDVGSVKPVIASVSSMAEIAAAHSAYGAGGTFGKRVVQLTPPSGSAA
jgi:NADPH:quinone reductase-like Zn-dependent oxidoreductase